MEVGRTLNPSDPSEAGVSIIDCLPSEILEHILLCVAANHPLKLPPNNSFICGERYYFACPALVLSWVCTRWRAITLANSAFWAPASIYISLTDYVADEDDTVEEHAARKARGLALVKCYLERSPLKPLPQVILYGAFADAADEDQWEAAFGDIVRYVVSTAHRWESCTLPGYIVEWLSVTPDAAPDPVLLEAAAIEEKYTDTVYDRLQFFLHAPRLRRWLGDIPNSATVSRLPWRQLTEVRIWQFMPIQRFMRLIRHCEQLVDLEVSLHRSAGAAPLPTYGSVLLAHLESATITLDNGEILSSLFATLVTPKLRCLVLNGSSPLTQWDLERKGHLCLQRWPTLAFDGWLERSRSAAPDGARCALQKLLLAHITMPRDDLVWILENLPHLRDLSLQELEDGSPERHDHASSIDDDVLRRMTVLRHTSMDGLPDRRPELLPELGGLTIAGVVHFDGRRLVDMVKSRADVANLGADIADAASPLEFLCIQPERGSTTVLDDAAQAQLRDILGDEFIYGDGHLSAQTLFRYFKEWPRLMATHRMQINIDAMEV
ncbi:uncharacterized protein SCHCODRAFT_02637548 [Schizophyllum commune H4-8]|nr:uncharacterized protein SCHCODRAFT_02637548 [Schizophyllum commune H4-8]KAI5888735.1 hypothetical protein SCHCODRAFT_02637548 [Schizophyllum commune H4-8]